MPREKVGDLVVRQRGSLQELDQGRSPDPDPEPGRQLNLWAGGIPLPWSGMMAGGVALVALGLVTAILTTWGLLGTAILTSLVSTGCGLTFLGIVKRRAGEQATVQEKRALSRSEHRLLEERSRRILQVLGELGRPATFDALVGRTRWTRDALLDTLLYMKEQGTLAEDLDLDTGEWVYAPADADDVSAARVSLMLEERRALTEGTETEG